MIICSMPACQTSVGCKCTTVWRNPAPDAAPSVPLRGVFRGTITGYAMAPTPDWERQAASIICGHDCVQRMTDDEQAEFEVFVREVIRTKAPPRL